MVWDIQYYDIQYYDIESDDIWYYLQGNDIQRVMVCDIDGRVMIYGMVYRE